MKSNKGRYILTGVIILLLLFGTVYAMKANRITFVDRLESGKVKIKVQQLTITEDGECEAIPTIVEANQDVSYIPRITNLNSDSYVRVKVEINMNGECEEPLGIEHIYGLGKGWISKGEYFYYQNSLGKREQVDLFEGIHIPENWDPGESEGFSAKITAEAIQSANFQPDFTSELPWGAVQLADISKGVDTVCRKATIIQDLSYVEYTSSGGFECSTSDLFSELEEMMPGDEYDKILKVKNVAENPITMKLDVLSESGPLMKEVRLIIKSGDVEIYQGTVAEAIEANDLNLGRMASGESREIKFIMYLPEGSTNEFSELLEQVAWQMTAEEDPDTTVQTGDFSNMVPYVIMLMTAGAIMILALKRKDQE